MNIKSSLKKFFSCFFTNQNNDINNIDEFKNHSKLLEEDSMTYQKLNEQLNQQQESPRDSFQMDQMFRSKLSDEFSEQFQSESLTANQFLIHSIKGDYKNESIKKIQLQDFEYIKVLGRGAFGKVVLVKKLQTTEYYAMKILGKEQIEKNQIRFYIQQEKMIMQNLDHPFIVQLHYAFQTPSKLYMIQDFMIGGDLFFHLERQIKFTLEQIKFYAAQLVLAIEYLHQNDIIYRDLKPENILLDQDGNIKITDFGLSKRGKQYTKTLLGTPEYSAPEIAQQIAYYKVVDWYSFGCLLFHFLTGKVPFKEENPDKLLKMKLSAKIKYPNQQNPLIIDLINKLLQPNPQKRLGTKGAHEIKNHLFFKDIDFDKVKKKEQISMFKPPCQSLNDVGNFDPVFTNETLDEIQDNQGKQYYSGYQMFDYHKN